MSRLLGAGEEAIEGLHVDATVSAEVVILAQPVLEALREGFERAEIVVGESR